MTKRLLSFVLAALMVFSMVPAIFAAPQKNIHQVDGAEPTVEIKNTNFVSYLGIIKGYPNGSLGLSDPVTRWMMALLAIRVLTGDVDDSSWLPDISFTTRFEDVSDGDTASLYLGAIALCAEYGFIRGIEEDGKLYFKPYDTITYVDALVIAVRLLGYESDEMNAGYPTTYTEKAYALGLDDGIEGVALKDEITRETVFQIIYNVLFAKRANSDKTFQEENFPYHTVKFVCTNTGEVLKTYTVVSGSSIYSSTGLTPAGFSDLLPGRPQPSSVYYGGDDGVYWSFDPYGENKLSKPSGKLDPNHFGRAPITEDTTLYVYYPPKTTTVNFVDATGAVIKTISGKGAWEVTAEMYPELPADTAEYDYTGWSVVGPFTVNNTTITVKAIAGKMSYDVTFVDKDGNQIGDVQTVEYGKVPAYPAAPVVEGMSFAGWSVVPGTPVVADVTIAATYTEDPVIIFNYVDANGTAIVPSQSVYLKADVALEVPAVEIPEGYKFVEIDTDLATVTESCEINVIYATESYVIGHFQGGVLVDEEGNAIEVAEGVDLSALISDVYTSLIRYGVTLWDGVLESADDVVEFANGKFYSEDAAEYGDYAVIPEELLDEDLELNAEPISYLYSIYLIDADGDGDYDWGYTIDYDMASYLPGYLVTYSWNQDDDGSLNTYIANTYATELEYELNSWMYIGYDYAKEVYVDDILYSEAAKELALGNITAASAITMQFTFEDGVPYDLFAGEGVLGYTFAGLEASNVIDFLTYNFTREPGDPDREYYYNTFDGKLVFLNEYGVYGSVITEEVESGDVYVVVDHTNYEYMDYEDEFFAYTAYKNGDASEKVVIIASILDAMYGEMDAFLETGDFFTINEKGILIDPTTGEKFEFYFVHQIEHNYDDVEEDAPCAEDMPCNFEYIVFEDYLNPATGEFEFGFTSEQYENLEDPYEQTGYYGDYLSDDATFILSFAPGCMFNYQQMPCGECAGCQLALNAGVTSRHVAVVTGEMLREAYEARVAEEYPAEPDVLWIAGHVWYNAENEAWMIEVDAMDLGDVDLQIPFVTVDGDYVQMLGSFTKDGVLAWEDDAETDTTIYTFATTGLWDYYTGADYAGAETVKTRIDFTKEEVFFDHLYKVFVITYDENGDAWLTEATNITGMVYTLAYELLGEGTWSPISGYLPSLEDIYNNDASIANRDFLGEDTFNMDPELFEDMLCNDVEELYDEFEVFAKIPYYGNDYADLSSILADGGEGLAAIIATIALAMDEDQEFSIIFTDLPENVQEYLIENQLVIANLDELLEEDTIDGNDVEINLGFLNLLAQKIEMYFTGNSALFDDLAAIYEVFEEVVELVEEDEIAVWALYDYVESLLAEALAAAAADNVDSDVVSGFVFYDYNSEKGVYETFELVNSVEYDADDFMWVFDAETGLVRAYSIFDLDEYAFNEEEIEVYAGDNVDGLTAFSDVLLDDLTYDFARGIWSRTDGYVDSAVIANLDTERFENLTITVEKLVGFEWELVVDLDPTTTDDDVWANVPVYEATDDLAVELVEGEIVLTATTLTADPYFGCNWGYATYVIELDAEVKKLYDVTATIYDCLTGEVIAEVEGEIYYYDDVDVDDLASLIEIPEGLEQCGEIEVGYYVIENDDPVWHDLQAIDTVTPDPEAGTELIVEAYAHDEAPYAVCAHGIYGQVQFGVYDTYTPAAVTVSVVSNVPANDATAAGIDFDAFQAAFEAGEMTVEDLETYEWGACPESGGGCGAPQPFVADDDFNTCVECGHSLGLDFTVDEWTYQPDDVPFFTPYDFAPETWDPDVDGDLYFKLTPEQFYHVEGDDLVVLCDTTDITYAVEACSVEGVYKIPAEYIHGDICITCEFTPDSWLISSVNIAYGTLEGTFDFTDVVVNNNSDFVTYKVDVEITANAAEDVDTPDNIVVTKVIAKINGNDWAELEGEDGVWTIDGDDLCGHVGVIIVKIHQNDYDELGDDFVETIVDLLA